MGIVVGFLCLICYCVLSAKAVTRRCRWKKADNVLMKLHKPVSGLLLVTVILHIILVIPVWQNRSFLVVVTGIAGVVCMIFLIVLCHRIMDRNRKIYWHRALTIIMAICIAGHMVTYLMDFNDYQEKVNGLTFDEIDLHELKDGLYEGECDVGYIYARVEVEIKEGRIVAVTLLEHRNERGKAAESILDDVVETQEIDVDTVSGATNSSKVIKKALEDAICNAKK